MVRIGACPSKTSSQLLNHLLRRIPLQIVFAHNLLPLKFIFPDFVLFPSFLEILEHFLDVDGGRGLSEVTGLSFGVMFEVLGDGVNDRLVDVRSA